MNEKKVIITEPIEGIEKLTTMIYAHECETGREPIVITVPATFLPGLTEVHGIPVKRWDLSRFYTMHQGAVIHHGFK